MHILFLNGLETVSIFIYLLFILWLN